MDSQNLGRKKISFLSELLLKEWRRNYGRIDLSFVVTETSSHKFLMHSWDRCVISIVISCFYFPLIKVDLIILCTSWMSKTLIFLRGGYVLLLQLKPLSWENNIHHNRIVRVFYMGNFFFFKCKFQNMKLSSFPFCSLRSNIY